MSVISGLKTNAVTIGTSNTDSQNFQLRSNADGTATLARKSDGSGGDVLTIDGSGVLTLASVPKVTAVQSMVRLNTANGYGSLNTAIRRFTNIVTNQGSDITYNSGTESTLGASFTINTNGVYAISYTVASSGSSSYMGISLNSTQLTIAIQSITTADRVALSLAQAVNVPIPMSVTLYLSAGSIIRPHTDAAAASSTVDIFAITRVS